MAALIVSACVELADTFRRDAAYLARLFRGHRATLLAAVGGVALALALAGGIVAAVSPTLFPRLGVSDPERLFRVIPPQGAWTYDDFRTFDSAAADLPAAGLVYTTRTEVRDTRNVLRVRAPAAFVSGRFFEVIGAEARAGRLFDAADDRPGRHDVAVLSYDAWERRFGRDTSIIGASVWVRERKVTIVGVMDPRFTGPSPISIPAVWMPLEALAVSRDHGGAGLFVRVLARAATGGDRERLLARVTAASDTPGYGGRGPRVVVVTGAGERPAGSSSDQPRLLPLRPTGMSTGAAMPLLLVLVLTLVVMALANLGGALLSIATSRERELATRLALGASTGRVIGQLLTESLVVGGVAGLISGFALYLTLPLLAEALDLPLGLHVRSDGRLFAGLVAAATSVAIGGGLSPVLYLTRRPVRGALAGTSGARIRPERLRAMIVGLQVGLSILCLIAAAVLTRGAARARAVEVGLDLDRLLAQHGTAVGLAWTPAEAAAYWDVAIARIDGMPGVAATAFATQVFGGGFQSRWIEAGGASHDVLINRTSSSYFATAGVPIVRGRVYSEAEVGAAVVSLGLARALGGLDSALDTTIRFSNSSKPTLTVVGVAGDVIGARAGLGELSRPIATLYQPLATDDLPQASLIVRAIGERAPLKRELERVLPTFLPDRPPGLREVGSEFAGQIERAQRPAQLSSVAGIALLVLTTAGLHGLISLVVRLRSRELAVRIALGAGPCRLALAAFRPALVPALCGVVAGALAAVAVLRQFAAALYGVPVFDLPSWSAAVAMLLSALCLGALLPLVRLRRLEPAAVLKAE